MRDLKIKTRAKKTAKRVGGNVLMGGMAVVAYTGVAVLAAGIYAMEAATITANLAKKITK